MAKHNCATVCTDCICSKEVLCVAGKMWTGVDLLKCQPLTLGIGYILSLDHLVHVTLGMEASPAPTVYLIHLILDHSTPHPFSALFRYAGIGIKSPLWPHTPTCPSPLENLSLDPSVKITLQILARQTRRSVIHCSLATYHCLFRMRGASIRALACIVNRVRQLHMVPEDIRTLLLPPVCVRQHLCLAEPAVHQANMLLLCRLVTGGRPFGGRSPLIPVSCRRCLKRRIILCDTFRPLVCSIPIARSLSTKGRRGMAITTYFPG